MTAASETPTNATDLAERALIGALLADPSRVRDVRDWLRPSDINHPKARAIYQTLTELHRHGRTVTIRELPVVIAADDGAHPTITAQDLHAYVQATSAASQQLGTQHLRSNHVIYARRVLEAAARRIVAIAGSRIQEATELSRDNPHLGAGDITATLAQTQQRLATLGQRLRHAQGSPGSLITAALGGPIQDTPSQECAGIEPVGSWLGAPSGPLTIRAVLEAERELLTSCLTNPALHAELAGWLIPQDFSRPEHAATWAAFNALAQAGTSIDYVTLAWQCQRHNPNHNSPGPSADQLATMARHTPGSPGPAVATVAQASLLRHTDAAREQVHAIAHNHAADALTVVSTAEKTYREIGEHARRLSGANGTTTSRISAALNPTTPVGIPPRGVSLPPTRPPDESPQRDYRRGR
ncbi:MAG TPA: DnaB-like helicase N-terminal domain-containing protein [Pseudonocardiaceae bacterium]